MDDLRQKGGPRPAVLDDEVWARARELGIAETQRDVIERLLGGGKPIDAKPASPVASVQADKVDGPARQRTSAAGEQPKPSSSRHPILDAALAYASRGWRVFPVHPEGKKPLLKGDEGKGGFHLASADPQQIRQWWRKWPKAMIGVQRPPATPVQHSAGPRPLGLAGLRGPHGPAKPPRRSFSPRSNAAPSRRR